MAAVEQLWLHLCGVACIRASTRVGAGLGLLLTAQCF